MSKVFKYSFISGGKFFTAGLPIADKDIQPFMMKYIVKEEKPSSKREINVLRQYNQPYYVDAEGNMTVPARRQAADLMAQSAEQDYIDALSNEPPDEATQAIIEELREDHQANVQKQIAQAECLARHADELDDDVVQKHEEKVQAGEFNDMDVPPAKPRPARVVGQKLFVKRNGKFIRAHDVDLVQGEPLYRHRPRALGQVAMFIKHATVK